LDYIDILQEMLCYIDENIKDEYGWFFMEILNKVLSKNKQYIG